MTNEQILKKAIEKAKDNGWETNIISVNPGCESVLSIFSHSFAKALWGEEWLCSGCGRTLSTDGCVGIARPHHLYTVISWQYHLRNMVIKEDPIQYLKKYL